MGSVSQKGHWGTVINTQVTKWGIHIIPRISESKGIDGVVTQTIWRTPFGFPQTCRQQEWQWSFSQMHVGSKGKGLHKSVCNRSARRLHRLADMKVVGSIQQVPPCSSYFVLTCSYSHVSQCQCQSCHASGIRFDTIRYPGPFEDRRFRAGGRDPRCRSSSFVPGVFCHSVGLQYGVRGAPGTIHCIREWGQTWIAINSTS